MKELPEYPMFENVSRVRGFTPLIEDEKKHIPIIDTTHNQCICCSGFNHLLQASFPEIFPDLDPFLVCQKCKGDGSLQKWLMIQIIRDNPEIQSTPSASLNMTAVAEGIVIGFVLTRIHDSAGL